MYDQTKVKQTLKETLITNGLGGYSLLPLNDHSFRKYHGLYTISLKPPVERLHILSKILIDYWDDTLLQWVSTNKDFESVDDLVENESTELQENPVEVGLSVTDRFLLEKIGLGIERSRGFRHGTNQMALKYVIHSHTPIKVRFKPLFNVRDHHDVMNPEESEYAFGYYQQQKRLTMNHEKVTLNLYCNLAYHMDLTPSTPSYYAIETERGYPDLENHLSPGYFELLLGEAETVVSFVIDIEKSCEMSPIEEVCAAILESEKDRLNLLKNQTKKVPLEFEPLIAASDQFIVERETTGTKTILAGYPWFTDWGRDTMIALPGLCLVTGRYAEALEIIKTFIAYQKEGIIPNNFPDEGQEPMYNTADGTLWLFQALYTYYRETKDHRSIEELYPVLSTIVEHHINGTINNVYVDQDGLLVTGDPTTQLTWMDVKVDAWVVTPRHGKAVEINALFYNALCIMNEFAIAIGLSAPYTERVIKLKERFNQVFWNKELSYLNDLMIDNELYAMIRPNMLLAISLSFPVLESVYWKSVVDVCSEHLYFDYGIRSLSPTDEEYHGLYAGNLLQRDGAYHRGTGWGWLLGPYLEAHYKAYNDIDFIKAALLKTVGHLGEGALGSYSENFDGDAPHWPRGCCAQAWSVSEVLRIAAWLESVTLDA